MEVPVAAGGPDAIFVVENTEDLKITIQDTAGAVEWYSYDKNGTRTRLSENSPVLKADKADCGYIALADGLDYSVWVCDYSTHTFASRGLYLDVKSGCYSTILRLDGECNSIEAYSPSGFRTVVDRELSLKYTTEELDTDASIFIRKDMDSHAEVEDDCISIYPPVYARTRFELSGDRFLKVWGREVSVSSAEYDPQAVMASAVVESNGLQLELDNTAELSAPVKLQLKGIATSGAAHAEWCIFQDGTEFADEPLYRLSGLQANLTLKEAGVYTALLRVADAAGECEAEVGPFAVAVSASLLSVPNTFILGAHGSSGTWRVSSESLIDFNCQIYDRHGQKVYEFNDPHEGWSGRRSGGYVSPGVYFYVIRATGADGRKYDRSGSINVLRRSAS